jgi:indolepyruvate ferredoxin oxidoreductase, beta subunit
MKMQSRTTATNIILAGAGGQGVITAGLLIGNAATQSGLNVVMSEVHGMSQRGGIVTVDLRIGDVYGPIISQGEADLILGFEAVETLRAMNRAGKNTLVIMSSERIVPMTLTIGNTKYPDIDSAVARLKSGGMSLYVIDTYGLAKESGSVISSNLVLVGAAYSSGLIPLDYSALEQSVRSMFSPKSWEANLKALRLGMERCRIQENNSGREEQVAARL